MIYELGFVFLTKDNYRRTVKNMEHALSMIGNWKTTLTINYRVTPKGSEVRESVSSRKPFMEYGHGKKISKKLSC